MRFNKKFESNRKRLHFLFGLLPFLYLCGCAVTDKNFPPSQTFFAAIKVTTDSDLEQHLETEGAFFHINLNAATIKIEQRIEKQRTLAHIALQGKWQYAPQTIEKENHKQAFMITNETGGQITIASDATIQATGIKKLSVELTFQPENVTIYPINQGFLFLDNFGGLCAVPPNTNKFHSFVSFYTNNTWSLASDMPLPLVFIGVCPSRTYDWPRSMIGVVHYSSHSQRYPTDREILDFSRYARVLELHSWIWKNRYDPAGKDDTGQHPPPPWWDSSWLAPGGQWIPENEQELMRVVHTSHALGMKVIPYVNCDETHGTQEQFSPTNRFKELQRLKTAYEFDGFYLDGLYLNEPEQSYFLAKALREMTGKEAWLTLHDTQTSYPFIQAYMDLVITSEHKAFDRWTSTSYRISNAIASIWPEIPLRTEDAREFLKALTDQSLQHNNRMIFMAGMDAQWRDWRLCFSKNEQSFMEKYYKQKLAAIAANETFKHEQEQDPKPLP